MNLNSSSPSANSNSKSKRNFNHSAATSSNPPSTSSQSNTSNKKKKITNQNQKTLGMAWGSNSRSSSRSSAFRNSPFPDFSSYMVLKNQKLHQQFAVEAFSSHSDSSLSSRRPIFEGVSIFVDGYTVPSSQELRSYMLKHGGCFENYFSRHSVTHIVCSNLPDSKMKNLRSFSGGLPVVKPTWVLDSVAANKLLSWVPYQLDQLASETDNQPKLSAFFSSKNCKVSSDESEFFSGQATSETGDPSLISCLNADDSIIGKCESTGNAKECHLVSHVNNDGRKDDQPTNSMSNQNRAELDDVAAADGSSGGYQPQTTVDEASLSVSDNCPGISATGMSSSSNSMKPTNKGHSTLTDANFVENYFKYSRLHFIGTWRNRYRKRFPTLSNGFRCRSSSDNASETSQKTLIIHVDMDCFFVSVIIRNNPDFREKPVAVCHSDSSRGTAEISSANYPARDYGVKAGMFVRDAKALCPQLVIYPYDFKAYEEVSDQFYDILHKYCNNVQAVSCDEAFLDISDSGAEDPQLLASNIRKDVLDITGCTASAGIANNMLMARVATKIAKPNGQCYIPIEQVDDYLHELPVKALPGIGRALEEKLKKREVKTCGQLRLISKESLQKDFGLKTGDMLWNYSRGIDNRLVGMNQESKSIGADVNWGVRFHDLNDTRKFIRALCKEVSLRLQGCGVLGRTFTLKMKKRKEAGEPVKYMGCGDCENLCRSITLPMATDDVDVLQRITIQLFGYFHIDAKDIRGMGLQASKLESADSSNQGHTKSSIRSWLVSSSARTRCSDNDIGKKCVGEDMDLLHSDTGSPIQVQPRSSSSTGEARTYLDATLPALHDIDLGVIESLPPEIFSDIDNMYAGELSRLISKKKERNANTVEGLNVSQNVDGVKKCKNDEGSSHTILSNKEEEIPCSSIAPENLSTSPAKEEDQENKHSNDMIHSRGRASNLDIHPPRPEPNNLMPLSLSQVDCSVLQQLPEELKADILESLPAHRKSDLVLKEVSSVLTMHGTGSVGSVLSDELWDENPPRWVENFRLSSCPLLNALAVFFQSSGATSHLSSILQRIMSEIYLPLDIGMNERENSVSSLCELIKQYVKFKVGTDIEEIYVCARILRRLALRSELFLQVYNTTLPLLQASVGEYYGGNLNISSVESSGSIVDLLVSQSLLPENQVSVCFLYALLLLILHSRARWLITDEVRGEVNKCSRKLSIAAGGFQNTQFN